MTFRLLVTVVFVAAITVLLSQCQSPIQAVYWEAPQNKGYTGIFEPNTALSNARHFDLGPFNGPEDIAIDGNNHVFASSRQGYILRLNDKTQSFEPWIFTGGKPLGLRFDRNNHLIVADALLGLLRVDPSGKIEILANQFNGVPFGFVDAVAVAESGAIYFTDASDRYSVREFDNPENASHLDILAHGGHGAVYQYTPDTGMIERIASGLQFANGIVVSHDEQSLLVNETGRYQVIKIGLIGDQRGQVSTLANNLPGFPDNIARNYPSGYWVGLVAPRNALLDTLSTWPNARELIALLPKALQPKAEAYVHVIHLNNAGDIVTSLQDPTGSVAMTTGAIPSQQGLWISSLTAKSIALHIPQQDDRE